MKASEILPIAKQWKKVFENLLENTNKQEELKKIIWINERFISILQAEDFLNQERTRLANRPTNRSSAYLYFLHMKNILDRYRSTISNDNLRRWSDATPYKAYNQRKSARQVLLNIALIIGVCKDLYLLLTSSLALPALLTLSHLTFLILPLLALGLWVLYDKYVYYPFDNHSFNLANMVPSLKKEMQEMMPNNSSGLCFFDKPENQEFIAIIDNEYQNLLSIS